MAWPQLVSHGLHEDGRRPPDLETFRQFHRTFVSAFPDLHVDVKDVLVEGDKTAIRIEFTGTHTGDGIGIPPTGRRFTATAIVIARWKEGKVIEAWNEFDAAGMMRQLQTPAAKLRV